MTIRITIPVIAKYSIIFVVFLNIMGIYTTSLLSILCAIPEIKYSRWGTYNLFSYAVYMYNMRDSISAIVTSINVLVTRGAGPLICNANGL